MVRFTDIRQWTGTGSRWRAIAVVELALAVADRGYVLAHGEIAASGASADMQANTNSC